MWVAAERRFTSKLFRALSIAVNDRFALQHHLQARNHLHTRRHNSRYYRIADIANTACGYETGLTYSESISGTKFVDSLYFSQLQFHHNGVTGDARSHSLAFCER